MAFLEFERINGKTFQKRLENLVRWQGMNWTYTNQRLFYTQRETSLKYNERKYPTYKSNKNNYHLYGQILNEKSINIRET